MRTSDSKVIVGIIFVLIILTVNIDSRQVFVIKAFPSSYQDIQQSIHRPMTKQPSKTQRPLVVKRSQLEDLEEVMPAKRKRGPSCLFRCLRFGQLHPAQCHMMCWSVDRQFKCLFEIEVSFMNIIWIYLESPLPFHSARPLFENVPKDKYKYDIGGREDISWNLVNSHYLVTGPFLLSFAQLFRWMKMTVKELVDQSKLYQAEEDEEYRGGNPDINSLGVGDRRQRLLGLNILCCQRQQCRHSYWNDS